MGNAVEGIGTDADSVLAADDSTLRACGAAEGNLFARINEVIERNPYETRHVFSVRSRVGEGFGVGRHSHA
jgi:hypothetical protein